MCIKVVTVWLALSLFWWQWQLFNQLLFVSFFPGPRCRWGLQWTVKYQDGTRWDAPNLQHEGRTEQLSFSTLVNRARNWPFFDIAQGFSDHCSWCLNNITHSQKDSIFFLQTSKIFAKNRGNEIMSNRIEWYVAIVVVYFCGKNGKSLRSIMTCVRA